MSGIGAAVAAHEMKTAESWLQTALKIWPDDPKVLLMGAKVASARGDYNRANKYYQAARAVSPPQQQTANGPQAGGDPQSQSQAVRDLASLLAPSNSRSGNSAVYSAQDPQKSGSLDELLYALPNERSAAPLGDTNSSQSAKVPSQKTSELAPWESSSPLAHGGPNPADGPKTLSPAPAANQNDSLDTFLNSGSASLLKEIQQTFRVQTGMPAQHSRTTLRILRTRRLLQEKICPSSRTRAWLVPLTSNQAS